MSTMSKRTAKRKNTKVAAEPNQQLVSENVKDLAPEKASMAVELSSPTVKFEEDATTDGESPIMQLLKWQQKLITDLEKERDFLRSQLSATTSGSTSRNLPTEIKEPLPKVLSSSSFSSSEDETSSSSEEKKSKKKIRREKHRTGRARKPEEVIKRYKDVLKTFRKVRTMSAAFHRHGLDRGTIASTASIAELAIADPGFYQEIKKANKETLLDFAKRCNAMSATRKQKIEEMKQNNELLPLQHSYN